MKRRHLMLVAAMLVPCAAPAWGAAPPSALEDAGATFAKIDDYSTLVAVHETDGRHVEDRVYHVMFKKPLMERVDVVGGAGKGSGIVWLGGEKVKGHRGGLLSGIHLTLDLHNSQVTTLRGDSVDTATIPSMLDSFTNVKGTVTQAAGPSIDGNPTAAVSLDVADAAAYHGVTREILYLSAVTHLPVRRERFAGDVLVKSENFSEMKTNVGLTAGDFPF